MGRDDDARRRGFQSAQDEEAHAEEYAIERWKAAGSPSPMAMWQQIDGVTAVEVVPLTVAQAARRENVHADTIRRKLDALAAMEPAGAYRVGDGARAPWRIVPAALDALRERTTEPKVSKVAPARAKKRAKPKKRSATRWEV